MSHASAVAASIGGTGDPEPSRSWDDRLEVRSDGASGANRVFEVRQGQQQRLPNGLFIDGSDFKN